jgi:hypothetical protein
MNIQKFFYNTEQTIIINYMLIILIITILVLAGYYIYYQATKKPKKDKYMTNTLQDVEVKLTSINPQDAKKKFNLRDYYIMSSYNSCCNGDFRDGYVSINALQNVIRKGARVIDFEIYNIDNEPVVACSNSDSFNFKGSYNSIPFSDVINIIKTHAFSASTCPNFNDPLIIHLRLKTNNTTVLNKVGKIISDELDKYRLGNKYDYEYTIDGKIYSLMNEPLIQFLGKVIIMTDRSNHAFIGTYLDEVTNISSNTTFCQLLRDYDIVYTPSTAELIEHNKKYTTISMCNLTQPTSDNMDSSIHMKYGCQMICMNFQSIDDHLVFYLEQFNEEGSAFKLKPEQLRYIPVQGTIPQKQNPQLSYAPKIVKKPYFSHKI